MDKPLGLAVGAGAAGVGLAAGGAALAKDVLVDMPLGAVQRATGGCCLVVLAPPVCRLQGARCRSRSAADATRPTARPPARPPALLLQASARPLPPRQATPPRRLRSST